MSRQGNGPKPRRRQVLAAAGIAATAGCVDRVRSLVNRNPAEPISLQIKTMPADDDPFGIRFAQALAENLEAAGVGAEVVPMETSSFLLSVLINDDYDLYVARAPRATDPDVYRPLLHSRFIGESGWQNPFGFADLEVDELLDEQRRVTGRDRRQTAADLQSAVVTMQPFTTLAIPDTVNAVRTDRFEGWSAFGVTDPLTYLSLEPPPEGEATLRVCLADNRPTRNLNPVAVEFRNRGLLTGLIYESLGRRNNDAIEPWLAREWSWEEGTDDPDEGPVATVQLRSGVQWHDGEPVAADDVAFTYQFLADTSLGEANQPVPAPRFRGRSSLVDGVDVIDDRTVRVRFIPSTRTVATRAFTVPVFPRHDWASFGTPVTIAGVPVAADVPEALFRENLDPVGCGPFRVVEVATDEAVVLERWDQHVLSGAAEQGLERFRSRGAGRIEIQVVPSTAAGVDLVRDGQADAVISSLSPPEIADVGRADEVYLRTRRSDSFYHVGYNNRRAPLSNPRFRQVVSRLLDRDRLVSDVFGGFASAARTPLVGEGWDVDGDLPALPFLGSDGDVDVDSAREAFRQAGYRYGEDDRLVA